MITVIRSFEFDQSLRAALSHPEAPPSVDFLLSEYVDIEMRISTDWDSLMPHVRDPYRRTLVATYPPGDQNVRFYYSVRAFLRPDGIVELEDISIDWDYRPYVQEDE